MQHTLEGLHGSVSVSFSRHKDSNSNFGGTCLGSGYIICHAGQQALFDHSQPHELSNQPPEGYSGSNPIHIWSFNSIPSADLGFWQEYHRLVSWDIAEGAIYLLSYRKRASRMLGKQEGVLGSCSVSLIHEHFSNLPLKIHFPARSVHPAKYKSSPCP